MENNPVLSSQREKFSLPSDISYLNCAYMSPLMKSVEAAGIEGMALKKTPHLITQPDFFDQAGQLRQAFARIIHAEDPERIVIIPSVSYGVATVAKNLHLSPGDKIIVAGEQFPSNVYAWQKLTDSHRSVLTTVAPPEVSSHRGKSWNERILEAIDGRTRLVAIGHVHWSDGTKFDLAAIRQRTREVGALLVVDGTQSVGALPFDVQELQPDALICAGYKWLMGPYGIGLAYFGEYFDEGEPLEEGWITRYGSEDFSGLVNYQDQYQPKSLRYEVGERSNFILVPMMLQALQEITQWGIANIQQYCRVLSEPVTQALVNKGYSVEDASFRGSHLFGVRLPSHISMESLRSQFQERKIYVSVRGKSIRVSPHLYNDTEQMEKLLACFES